MKNKENGYINVKVQDVKKRDKGRHIARLDEDIMEKKNIKTGDIILIKGKEETAAIVWPNYPQDKGKGTIRIDSRLRENTKININANVQIKKVKAKEATAVKLSTSSTEFEVTNSNAISFIKRRLNKLPITLNDLIINSIGNSKEIKFKVEKLEPENVCIITPNTSLSINQKLPEGIVEPMDKNYNPLIIKEKLKEFLKEDCQFKDISSSFIPELETIKAKIIAKSDGYISGLLFFRILCNICDVESKFHKLDGQILKKGEKVVELIGDARSILLLERVGLNLLTHMSAITSTTRKFVNLIQKMNKTTRIAGTRKTLPGLRIFEKAAIEIGGGDSHRFSLDDMILLKDTHLRYYDGEVKALLKDVKEKASFSKKVEIELEKVEDVLIAAKNGADIIMLDNMNPDQVKNAINLLKEKNLRANVLIEISGGIDINNISPYLEAEPDIISSSKLTQFPSEEVDLSLRFY